MKQGYISCTVLEYLSMKFLIPVSEEEQQEKIEQKEAYCRLFSKGGGKNGEPKETIACKNEL